MTLLASEDYIWMDDAYSHNGEVTVAGTTFARTLEFINGYSIQFENTGSQYSVRLTGSNNNLFDVANGILTPTSLVTVISTNSAGLVNPVDTPAGQQSIRDAMELESTSGQASVDTKLNNNFAVSAAGL
jgi:hypothetical protein